MILHDEIKTEYYPASIPYTMILPENPKKTVYWLHGYDGDDMELLREVGTIEQIAEMHSAAIVMPSMGNYYYLDRENRCSSKAVGEILLNETRQKYPLSVLKENTCIAGVSMGGYGALLIGARCPGIFGRIACVSGAFIQNDIVIGNPQVVGTGIMQARRWHSVFGDFSELEYSVERNPVAAAGRALEKKLLPPVFLSCGEEDMVYEKNEIMKKQLTEKGAVVCWYPHHGGHSWDSFAVSEAFAWLCF